MWCARDTVQDFLVRGNVGIPVEAGSSRNTSCHYWCTDDGGEVPKVAVALPLPLPSTSHWSHRTPIHFHLLHSTLHFLFLPKMYSLRYTKYRNLRPLFLSLHDAGYSIYEYTICVCSSNLSFFLQSLITTQTINFLFSNANKTICKNKILYQCVHTKTFAWQKITKLKITKNKK